MSSFDQLEDLYVEILYTILHMIGCDADQQKKLQLIQHLQNAFFMEQDKHQQLLDIASMREVEYKDFCQKNTGHDLVTSHPKGRFSRHVIEKMFDERDGQSTSNLL